MNNIKKITVRNNVIYSILFQLLIIVLPLITSPYISRVLGADGIGTQTYYYSISTYFYMFAMLGVNNYGNRSIAQNRNNREDVSKTFWDIFCLQFIRSILILCCYIIFVFIYQSENIVIALLNGLYVFSAMFEINWLFFGLEKFQITVTRNAIVKILTTVLIFLVVKSNEDLWKYSFLICGSSILTNIILWVFLKKYVDFYKPKFKNIKRHILPDLILFIPVLSISLYTLMGRIMIAEMSSKIELGYFTNAETIIAVPLSFIVALGNVMMPHASNLISNNDIEKSKEQLNKTMIFVLFLSVGMSTGISAVSNIFSVIFWGEDFIKSGILISGLAIKIVFISWANVIRTQYLIPNNKDREYIISVSVGAVVNLFINIIMIPKYGAFGAVFGAVFAELMVALIQTIFVRKDLPIFYFIKNSYTFFISGAVMYFFLKFFLKQVPNNLLTLIISMIFGVLIYCALIIILVKFSSDKRNRFLKKFLKLNSNG